jgi:hypothetical protein
MRGVQNEDDHYFASRTSGYHRRRLFFFLPKNFGTLSRCIETGAGRQFPLAMSLDISALMSVTDQHSLPSKAQAMASSPEAWIRELTSYLTWLTATAAPSKKLADILSSIERVGKNIENKNNLVEVSVKKATVEDYQKKWTSIFFPEGKTPPSGQQQVIEKAMDTSVSILTLIGNPNYRYDGKAVNRTTGKTLDFTVFSEGQFSFLIPQGNYYLIVTSKASFQGGQTWVSPANVIALAVPDSTSLLSGKLITDIRRRK